MRAAFFASVAARRIRREGSTSGRRNGRSYEERLQFKDVSRRHRLTSRCERAHPISQDRSAGKAVVCASDRCSALRHRPAIKHVVARADRIMPGIHFHRYRARLGHRNASHRRKGRRKREQNDEYNAVQGHRESDYFARAAIARTSTTNGVAPTRPIPHIMPPKASCIIESTP